MSFDRYAPYGSVVGSSLRLVTWNVWGRYGQWQERQAAIGESLAETNPDIVCLVESSSAETTQAELVAARIGVEHHVFAGDWDQAIGFRVSAWFPAGRSRESNAVSEEETMILESGRCWLSSSEATGGLCSSLP
jgi:endonuclease/exonuclease/phosphatase family metal-dependent hydrolase